MLLYIIWNATIKKVADFILDDISIINNYQSVIPMLRETIVQKKSYHIHIELNSNFLPLCIILLKCILIFKV